MQNNVLLSPYTSGELTLANRLVMAPMTRNRAGAGNVPTPLNETYYTQRASAGLIITEATQVSPQGIGYMNTPGIYTAAQVAGWKKVTDAVHSKGGKILLQLWHVGRISHPVFHNGNLPVAPSAIRPDGKVFTPGGQKDFETPRALTTEEISGVVEDFRQGAIRAKQAGFDGVEIHGGFGYLIEQFLTDGANQRTDQYGGSVANRTRFALEIVAAAIEVWGKGRVGIRLAPSNTFNSISDSNPALLYDYLIGQLNGYDLAYVHLVEPLINLDHLPHYIQEVTAHFRNIYKATIITNGGYDLEKANRVISEGTADLVAFGSLFLANPDLPGRFAANAPLNTPDRATFYGGTEKGYTDYPFLATEEVTL